MSIIDKILYKLKTELNKPEKLDEITQSIIEPIVLNCIKSLYPYFMMFLFIIILLFVLIFSILFLNIKICYK
jgi:hypothetical protein